MPGSFLSDIHIYTPLRQNFEKSLWPKDHRLFLFYIILKAYETIAPQAG